MSHVTVLKINYIAFHGKVTTRLFLDIDDLNRNHIIDACWDEYAVCLLSSGFSVERTVTWFDELFSHCLRETDGALALQLQHIRHIVTLSVWLPNCTPTMALFSNSRPTLLAIWMDAALNWMPRRRRAKRSKVIGSRLPSTVLRRRFAGSFRISEIGQVARISMH